MVQAESCGLREGCQKFIIKEGLAQAVDVALFGLAFLFAGRTVRFIIGVVLVFEEAAEEAARACLRGVLLQLINGIRENIAVSLGNG
ncbi:hypothetical protein KDK_15620 [Dictyobacter kobayashii]|uniref:Uncharacterized protein n=1 Tax=Dictyobacter kobayashii TaxID=2014872 RepID=A0A402AFB6_9CHLR|nr:hypothetical protein KDK_15620 [Dictyobacter kobayashii]